MITRTKKWHNYSGLDIRAIGLFRFLLGLALILDLLMFKIPYIREFFTDEGVIDRLIVLHLNPIYQWGLLTVFSTDISIYAFFGVTLLAYGFYMLGINTKIAGIVAFIGLWSIQMRNPIVTYSGPDDIFIIMLFWSLFLPIDEKFCIKPVRRQRSSNLVGGWVPFLMLVQISFIYFVNGITKNGYTWTEGWALTYALQEDFWIYPSAAWLMQFENFCRITTYGVRFFEIFLPVFLLTPVWIPAGRLIAALAILTFHIPLFFFLDIGIFPSLGPIFGALLLPSFVYDKFWAKAPEVPEPNLQDVSREKPFGSIALIKNGLAIVFTVYIIYINIVFSISYFKPVSYPSFIIHIREYPLMQQRWNMFAPDAIIQPGWARVAGVLENTGQRIDLSSGKPYDQHPPDYIPYKINPWQRFIYLFCVYQSEAHSWQEFVRQWAAYEMKKWNNEHPDNPVREVQVIKYQKTIEPPGISQPTLATTIYRHKKS